MVMARRIWFLAVAVALFAPGCKDNKLNWDWWNKKPPDGDRAAGAAADAPADATPEEREIERLREETRTLTERLKEVTDREDRLAKKVKQQEFINDQLRKQLQAVGDAPLERDQCKARCIRLEQHIKELETQLAELMKLRLTPSTRPAGE